MKQTRNKNKRLGSVTLRKDKARERKGNFYFEINQKKGTKLVNVLHNFVQRDEKTLGKMPFMSSLLIKLAKNKLKEDKEALDFVEWKRQESKGV